MFWMQSLAQYNINSLKKGKNKILSFYLNNKGDILPIWSKPFIKRSLVLPHLAGRRSEGRGRPRTCWRILSGILGSRRRSGFPSWTCCLTPQMNGEVFYKWTSVAFVEKRPVMAGETFLCSSTWLQWQWNFLWEKQSSGRASTSSKVWFDYSLRRAVLHEDRKTPWAAERLEEALKLKFDWGVWIFKLKRSSFSFSVFVLKRKHPVQNTHGSSTQIKRCWRCRLTQSLCKSNKDSFPTDR